MGGFKPPITVKALSPLCQAIPIKPVSAAIATRISPSVLSALHSPPQGGELEGGLYIPSSRVFSLFCPVLITTFLRITRGHWLVSTNPRCLSCVRPSSSICVPSSLLVAMVAYAMRFVLLDMI